MTNVSAPSDSSARVSGTDHVRPQAERASARVPVGRAAADEHLVGQSGDSQLPVAARRRARRSSPARRQRRCEFPRPRDLLGIDVRDGEPLERAVLVDESIDAPVGEARDGEVGDARERLLVVERRREQRARLGQEGKRVAARVARARRSTSELRLADREREPVGDQLEQPHVRAREVRRLARSRRARRRSRDPRRRAGSRRAT